MDLKMKKLISEINYYANLTKKRPLTNEELKKRDTLRKEYLSIFRSNFENQLKAIKKDKSS